MAINILLLDCQKMFVEGLESIIREQGKGLVIKDSCCNFSDAQKLLRLKKYDLIVLELNILDRDGIDILRYIKKEKIEIKKLVLSAYVEPKYVRAAMLEGADGYVSKYSNTTELFQAIEEVKEGGVYIGENLSTVSKAYDINAQDFRKVRKIQDSYSLRKKLTKREREILRLILDRKNNREIGKALYISHQTVGVHKNNIIKKLGLKNTDGLITFAQEHKLLQA